MASDRQANVATPSWTFREGEQPCRRKRVLRRLRRQGQGPTVGVAEEIGKTLGGAGFRGRRPTASRAGPRSRATDAAVIGSAVNQRVNGYPKRWSWGWRIRTQVLSGQRPVAVFCVHGGMNGGSDEKQDAPASRLPREARSASWSSRWDEAFFLGPGGPRPMTSIGSSPAGRTSCSAAQPRATCGDWGKKIRRLGAEAGPRSKASWS